MLLSKVYQTLRISLVTNEKMLLQSAKKYITTNKSGLSSQNSFSIISVHKNMYKPKIFNSHLGLISKQFCQFSKTKSYIDLYNNTQTEIKQKKQKVIELQQKIKMLQKMSEMTTKDQILKVLFSIFGKTYETQAFKQHKQILIDLRNILEKRIEESSIKWQQPRKLILEEREKKVHEFLQKIIQYEGKLAEFIKKRENNKAEHLADINQGLVLTHKLLIKNIEKQGGLQVWAEKDQPFDEKEHQLIQQGKTSKKSSIKDIYIPGWKLKGKVIRKARVTVN